MNGLANPQCWRARRAPPAAESRAGERRWLLRILIAVLALASGSPLLAAERRGPAVRAALEALEAGNVQQALQSSQAAVEGGAPGADAWLVRGYVLSRAGHIAEAARAYIASIGLMEHNPTAHNNLGTVYLRLGDLKQARVAFEAALALNPRYADARNNRGVVLQRMGQLEAALVAYQAAMRLDPTHERARGNLRSLMAYRARVRTAASQLHHAASAGEDSATPWLSLSLVGAGGGEDLSLEQLEAAAARPGASVDVRVQALSRRAARALEEKDLEEARRQLEEALRLAPFHPAVLNNLAVVEDRLGMDRQALLHLGEVLRRAPRLSVARNNIGIVHVHRGDLKLAESVFRALIRDAPRFHRAHYNLGVVLAARGSLHEAHQAFQEALRLEPRDAEARYNLTLVEARIHQDVAAERRGYEAALRHNPNLTEAHLALGALLADPETKAPLRDPVRARRHLTRFLALVKPTDERGKEQARAWLAFLEASEARERSGSPGRMGERNASGGTSSAPRTQRRAAAAQGPASKESPSKAGLRTAEPGPEPGAGRPPRLPIESAEPQGAPTPGGGGRHVP